MEKPCPRSPLPKMGKSKTAKVVRRHRRRTRDEPFIEADATRTDNTIEEQEDEISALFREHQVVIDKFKEKIETEFTKLKVLTNKTKLVQADKSLGTVIAQADKSLGTLDSPSPSPPPSPSDSDKVATDISTGSESESDETLTKIHPAPAPAPTVEKANDIEEDESEEETYVLALWAPTASDKKTAVYWGAYGPTSWDSIKHENSKCMVVVNGQLVMKYSEDLKSFIPTAIKTMRVESDLTPAQVEKMYEAKTHAKKGKGPGPSSFTHLKDTEGGDYVVSLLIDHSSK